MQIKISSEYDNKTIKDFLKSNDYSSNLIKHLKSMSDGIMLNGSHATVRRVLKENDILSLKTEDTESNPLIVPTQMPIEILYEDDDILAVNKPHGIPTHPSHGHFEDTLANGLAFLFEQRHTHMIFRAINRLDRGTSGVVLTAKNSLAADKLSKLMKSGKIRKKYIAVVNGMPPEKFGIIDNPIRRVSDSVITREVCEVGTLDSKPAITEYTLIKSYKYCSLVEARPLTGRTHQIRVHLSYLGCPIAGDWLYGTAETSPTDIDKMFDRPALHCASLKIDFGERILEITAPTPCDIENALKVAE